jgi:hypothetical protein
MMSRGPEVLEDAFGHWFAGFMDGEGHFGIGINGVRRNRQSYRCVAGIQVRHDDGPILAEVHERLGMGRLYGYRERRDRPAQSAEAIWRVDACADCVALVAVLDRYPLRAKKSRDFAIWRRAVAHWAEVVEKGTKPFEWGTVPQLREELMALRAPVRLARRSTDSLAD